jgi:hypothetical protein
MEAMQPDEIAQEIHNASPLTLAPATPHALLGSLAGAGAILARVPQYLPMVVSVLQELEQIAALNKPSGS